ncbi:TPA: 3-deoxy-D-manno-octulosonic acid kinase [Vibrio cholerae]|uniref:3-deoxy-D-manno-octulosonic acid kinase n=1 Tax=Vibrio cholerae TaxID=666 RepID=UPI000D21EC13|nr:3-deoxy-D-manno-octulosonic acid kinase [Vibrio cholerae]SPM19871.1 3-deoxy-D-manno-octulosonic-acid kinase,3-deoxy-D -manno-octulosonic acid kinase,3-deoxy-D-manno-octulosonic-acid kinase,Kae1-associated kinase Bud32,Lipopolysaccharide kinase (Kdo/WaaP) family [Vibrio cholerae]
MIQTFNDAQQKVWFDDALLHEDPSQCCNPEFWQQNGKVLGSATGRGTTWFVQLQQTQGALRHYRRGGLFGKLVADSYGFTGWEKTRSYQEFMLLNHLRDAGVNVPRPIAARVQKHGLLYKADLLSEKVPNARDLVSILQESPISDELYRKIGREIRKMHDAQVNHTDLNIHNILIDDQDKVWIIDFDKCYVQSGDGWKESNLERLKRSFEKERRKRAVHWSEDEFYDVLSAYKGNL